MSTLRLIHLVFLIAFIYILDEPVEQIGSYDPNESYCFRFTWFGPDYTNETTINTTCKEYLDSSRAKNTPCKQPIVITDNGAPPDMNYMWENHRDKVLCRQTKGKVCAKYTYSFDQQLENITYMCTKVMVPGKGIVDSGCYSQKISEYDVQVCVCKSTPGPGKPCNSGVTQKKLVCYFASWAVYRPGVAKYDIEDINPNLCTHIIYTFAGVQPNGTIKVLDKWNDVDSQGFVRFNKLKLINPNLKTLIAVGGWSEGSVKFSVIAGNPQYRQNFITSAIAFINTYQFNGIDIDWEHPAQGGGVPADKVNFPILISELRQAIGSNYLLTIAVAATPYMVDISYDVPQLSAKVDFINLMTYDLHGVWDQATGANSPLYSLNPTDPISVSSCVSYWLSKGAPASKIIVGIPIYGRTFTLQNTNSNNMGAPITGPGNPGPYTQEAGTMIYNEIYELLQTNQWTRKWDNVQKVPYLYKGNQWISYDDERSVALKAAYITCNDLGGAMVWSIDMDPIYVTVNGKNPIINKIKLHLLE
ncbi:hypothetical protein FQR65_LT05405 [Abscondita terminalis]|nr:hypothetical protein FQR65_LT05405 [Abscondita terminalis]